MSTDYGFKCVDCDVTSIVDNLRVGGVPLLKNVLANLTAIDQLIKNGINVSVDNSYHFHVAIRFAIEHQEKQHLVAVSDEYGRVWGLCSKFPTCAACRQHFRCTRDDNHEGECQPC